jgi:hypothetical protein
VATTRVSSPVTDACGASATTGDVAVRGRTVVATWTAGAGEDHGNTTDLGLGQALSRDGGRTFTASARRLTTCAGGSLSYVVDPDLALGADGTPWLSASGVLPVAAPTVGVELGEPSGTVLVQVGDAPPRSVFPGVAAERGFLETDPDDPARGHVLGESLTSGQAKAGTFESPQRVLGGPEGSLLLASTRDRGATWTRTTLRTPSSLGTGLLALGLVRTGRALVALSTEYDLRSPGALVGVAVDGTLPAPVAAQTSVDDGRTWSQPVVLDHVQQGTLLDASAGDGLVAVAAAQLDGTLAVWTSGDQGRRWRRSTAATGVAQPSTAVAVDDAGRVGVLSYRSADGRLTPQISLSEDRGRTFAVPRALAASFSPEEVDTASHLHPVGPYQGADAEGRHLLFAFTAQGTGRRLEVRLARL